MDNVIGNTIVEDVKYCMDGIKQAQNGEMGCEDCTSGLKGRRTN
jgi:hypothetical protein